MSNIIEFIKSDIGIIVMSSVNIALLLGILVNFIRISNIKKKYNSFMSKLENGDNIEEALRKYIEDVEKVRRMNDEIVNYCKQIDYDMSKCIQKIGIVRYSAFKDTGSDLSFALAMLDENNNGVVLNGIYSREMSNIYAKPIEKGESKYTVSEEEKEAIKRAVESEQVYKIR